MVLDLANVKKGKMDSHFDLDTDTSFVLRVSRSALILHYSAAFLAFGFGFYMALEGLISGSSTGSEVAIIAYSLIILVFVAMLPRVRIYHSIWVDRDEHTIALSGPGFDDEFPVKTVNFVTHVNGLWRQRIPTIWFFTLNKTYRIHPATPGLDIMLRMMAAEYGTTVEEPVYKLIQKFTVKY